ncbi:unnamed protein product [Fusarium venenatum]|uniref:GST N-terminal domain-containing protein n=2 Tax=Fusarium venenatum TaxID=56646 RepID=A0A2L2SX90_9HYPO|nr:uncharacterized protein FVRRES_06910 [Fusarium venenatum]CEI62474.1 unnamed protein product [Fusarium venenatum]
MESNKITFYDITPRPPVGKNAYAPNPWKARFALNFKGAPYSTTWVALPDIAKTRTSLNVPAGRQFADGKDFHTLPIIQDPTTGALVGDSFDIALYLNKTYSGGGDLFPPQKLDFDFEHPYILIPLSECNDKEFPDYAKFNMNIDAAFTAHLQLGVQGMPFEPATEEESKAEFVRRAGVSGWEDFVLSEEARAKLLESLEKMLGDLAVLFLRDTNGPFLLGQQVSYADMIVGAWLRMMSITFPEDEWKQVATCHQGVFGKLHDALKLCNCDFLYQDKHNNSIMSFEIYTGAWTDWSRSRVLGATLTLSSRDASLLLAFIAAFVTVVAIRLWLIIAFTTHQFSAAGGKHDGLYYQRQVILRNIKSAPAAAWLFLQQAWYWRGIVRSSLARTIPLALFCIMYSVGFAILAVFSSQISDSASVYRLLHSPNCGFQMTDDVYQKATFDNQRAALYSKECYGNTSSPICDTLPTRRLDWANSSTECPFGGRVCLGVPAFKMESGMIDTHHDLGLNNPQKNRLKYKRQTTCSPLDTGNFTQYVNGSEAELLGWPDNVLIRYFYGKNMNGKINHTYTYNTFGRNINVGYSTWTYFYTDNRIWQPIDELLVPGTDLTIMFIAPNSVIHLKPNDDPVFAASIRTSALGVAGYFPDRWVSPIACVDQHQICNPNNEKCTSLLGRDRLIESAMEDSMALNVAQIVTAQLLKHVLGESSPFYHTIWTRTQSFLRAQEKVAGITGQQLPSNQWEIEMSALFDDTLANLQYHMMEYAAGSSAPAPINPIKPWGNSSANTAWDTAYKNMCYNQRTKETQGTLNFSILGLGLLFGIGLYIIVLSFILEFLMAWIQTWLGRGVSRARRWERDGTLQQMRLLYEIQGSGDWKGTTEDFPCTVSGEYFDHDEEVISTTPVQVRRTDSS